jgi:hypothetical protein
MVVTPRGDSVRVPFFKDSQLGDTTWVVPLVVFWQVVLQDPVLPSLRTEYTEYHEDGTLLMEQLDECYDFFLDPPVGCGLTHPIAEATLDIWWDSAQQYLGYLKKHGGRYGA